MEKISRQVLGWYNGACMRLILINSNPLPSSDTESLQFIQSATALTKISEVYLIARKGISESVETYYKMSIPENLYVHLLPGLKVKIKKVRISSNIPFFLLSLFRILNIIRRQKITAIIVRNLKIGYFLLKCRRLLSMPPIIFESHEIFTMSFRDEMARRGIKYHKKGHKIEKMERFVYKNADGIICMTGQIAKIIKEQFVSRGHILVAPNGVDLEHFCQNKEPLHNHGFYKTNTILYIGSLHYWKGIDVLLKSMQYLNNDVKLIIVGGTPEAINRYQTLADELNISHRVRFEGFVPPDKRFNFFSRADVCVLPLRCVSLASYSTSPLKLFEYMAAGKPIVASDLPAIREILSNNVNAVLVAPDDPNALSEGISRLLSNHELALRLSQQASLDVMEYTWDKRAERIKKFIESHWS
jgi:glycosyltransferase involved in cell wall biosynthesis